MQFSCVTQELAQCHICQISIRDPLIGGQDWVEQEDCQCQGRVTAWRAAVPHDACGPRYGTRGVGGSTRRYLRQKHRESTTTSYRSLSNPGTF